ncbi:xylosidase : arabinofuranosidase [Roridomyces roridus]|uniref:Xylosidase: arabinofuranosidase n=1 Tax=Roridomyces roridus TaxID=1738132 RepID=A0AAD7BB87_9AGAR|nr:xylosidase : arabinofuranosidase [Roridomyces roridus]
MLLSLYFLVAVAGFTIATNKTHLNPTIPGWHSDPSCVFVPEWDNTFFCATSTFLVTPGIPIHASKDLVNWRLASHALNRESQWPHYNTTGQNDGIFAVTLRYRDGVFYAITFFVSDGSNPLPPGLLLKTTDPFDDNAWSDEPVLFQPANIDPDLFWDDDGQAYLTVAESFIATIDVNSGAVGPTTQLWNGTGERNPEGPHIYKKDGWYYLLIAEGGTEVNHTVTMARSRSVTGTYIGFEGNPVLTNKDTGEYFQTVGHADLFHDVNGNWWTCALATRSGPEWVNYPMGREMVITPARWDEGEFPVISPVRGSESAWALPTVLDVRGTGPIYGNPDVFDFAPGSALPSNMIFWRWPDLASFTISPPGHPNTLRIIPSQEFSSNGVGPISLIGRLQTDTLFEFSIDVAFAPTAVDEEAGATVFLTQFQHVDLGIVLLSDNKTHLRLQTNGGGNLGAPPPAPVIRSIPSAWRSPITLTIRANNDTHYTFSAAPQGGDAVVLGALPSTILSGGTGPFTGTIAGAYATANNGTGTTPAYISSWRYTGIAQKIDNDTFVPS